MHLARASLAVIAVATMAAVTTGVSAQQLSDWQRGRNLARQVCAE